MYMGTHLIITLIFSMRLIGLDDLCRVKWTAAGLDHASCNMVVKLTVW